MNGPEVHGPVLWGLVKSKCFSNEGVHKCGQQGHVCIRRISSCAGLPWKNGWRSVGKGLQGMLMLAANTWDVWDLQEATEALRAAMSMLGQGGLCCRKCRCSKKRLVVKTYDASQAFEALDPRDSLRGLWQTLHDVKETYGTTYISVARSKKLQFKPGRRRFSGGETIFSDLELRRALFASLSLCGVSFGDKVYVQKGIPTGGMHSRIALSYALCCFERKWTLWPWRSHVREWFA
ncbi:MAG: hypothetical protein ACKPKO_52670, partial [Candidatus Fonsibacter sp.]